MLAPDQPVRRCRFCIMDESEPGLAFDATGRCQLCVEMERSHGRTWFTDDAGASQLEQLLGSIARAGKGKEFDSILGLSGGLDSSYLALRVKEWGLRPLVVHVDGGWNSELAVANIQGIVDYCDWELHTTVINWEEMRDLQLAYLRAGVANQEVPQDHAFFAGLYEFATSSGIRHVLSGSNTATEGIYAGDWHWPAMDGVNLRAIHEAYGEGPLRDYPVVSPAKYMITYPFLRRMTPVRPLNLIPYDPDKAALELEEKVGWKSYPRKHGESFFTKFNHNYYLPARWGYDKRMLHLSSRIVSGQVTRAAALAEMSTEPLYDSVELQHDTEYFKRKMRISDDEYQELLDAPLRSATEFKSWTRMRSLLKTTQDRIQRVTGRRVSRY